MFPKLLAASILCGTLIAQTSGDALLKSSGEALDKGEYAKAIQQATDAAAIFEKTGDNKLLAEAANIVGAAHLYQGNYESARPQFAKSLTLARAANDPSNEIRLLNNLGNVDFFLSRYVPAFQKYQAAVERARGFEKQDWYSKRHRVTLANLAVLHLQLGQNQRALDLYRQALALPGEIFPSERAQILTNLAICYRRLGDPYKALDRYHEAQRLLVQDPDAAASLYTLHNIGVAQALDLEDPAAALRTFQQALQLASKNGNQRETALEHLFLGETYLRMNRAAAARAEFQQALAAARKLNLVAEHWTALYGLGRAHSLEGDPAAALRDHEQALAIIEPLRSSLTVSSLKAEFLADKRDVYDAVIAILIEQNADPAEIFRRVEQARARNLQEYLPGSVARDLAEVQRALGPQTAILDYWVGADRIAVIRVTRDGIRLHHAPLRKQQIADMESLAKTLIVPGNEDWESLVPSVSKTVFDPAWKLNDGATEQFIVVPDGVLHAIPFEILHWDDTAQARLIERYDVWYLPSAQFRHVGALQKKWPWEVSVAAFANPLVTNAASENALFENAPKLARAEQEARTVARVLPGRSLLFLGQDNLKRHLFEKPLASIPVLHFATHATVDTTDSRRSRLLFTPENGGDPYLFGSEIAKLDLHGVQLVTLAACESERGRFVRGEGPESLSRAFLATGASASVSSLWKVSDAATERLMSRFYSRLANGESKAAALRGAKMDAIRAGDRYSQPYYWAAFVLTGDGGTALPTVVRWWWFAIPLAVVGLFAMRYRMRRGSA